MIYFLPMKTIEISKPMKAALVVAVALCLSTPPAHASNTHSIFPEGRVPLLKETPPEKMLPLTDENIRITNVTNPTVTVVRANDAGDDPVPAVMICPGGGYGILAWTHEGCEIAQWFKNRGITAFILKYRVPGQPEAALCDAQRALGWIRANAVNFNVNPNKIGAIGFSAGANLVARLSTNWRKRAYEPVDDTDRASCRPDFAMLVYPWMLVEGDNKEKELPLKLRETFPVDKDTPPTFLVQSMDDMAHVENSLAWCEALKRAKVACEMHVFTKGGHGYGMRTRGKPTDVWPVLAEAWLSEVVDVDVAP